MIFFNSTSTVKVSALLLTLAFMNGCNALKQTGNPVAARKFCNGDSNFCINEVDATAIETNKTDELGNRNEKVYNFKACVTDPLERTINVQRPFYVSDGKEEKLAHADGAGCIRWQETLKFDPNESEKYFVMERTFRATQGLKGSNTIKFKFNPWKDNGGILYNMFADIEVPASYLSEKSIDFSGMVSDGTNDNQVLMGLNNIGLELPRHDENFYEVDNNLNLTIAHKYRVVFSPSLIRKSFGDLYDELNLKKGKVRVTLIFLRNNKLNPNLEDFDNYITHTEHDFTVTPNLKTIKEDLIFKWPDISSLETRMKVLVRLQPLVASKSVRPVYFEGDIAKLPGGTIDLLNTSVDVDMVLGKFKQILAEAKKIELKPKDNFIYEMGKRGLVAVLTDQDLVCPTQEQNQVGSVGYFVDDFCRFNPGVSQAPHLKNWLDYSPEKSVTRATLPLQLAKKLKLKTPYFQNLTTTKVTFVEEILQVNPDILGNSKAQVSLKGTFSTGYSFGVEDGQNWNKTVSAGAEASFDPVSKLLSVVGSPLTGIPGVSFSLGANAGWSHSHVTSRSNSISNGMSHEINWRFREIPIRARFVNCAVITGKYLGQSRYARTRAGKDADAGKTMTALYCSKPYVDEYYERYYFIADDAPVDNFQDGASMNDRTWVMFIRGAPYFNLFEGFMKNKQINLSMTSRLSSHRDETLLDKNGDVFESLSAYKVNQTKYLKTTQAGPGLITDMRARPAADIAKQREKELLQLIEKQKAERLLRIKHSNTAKYE